MIINNGGYTIERAIHGAEQSKTPLGAHNTICSLQRYCGMVPQYMLDFGSENGQVQSKQVRSKAEFRQVYTSVDYLNPTSIQVLEVLVERMDVPWGLKAQIEIVEANKTRPNDDHDRTTLTVS
ncbi:uncharacterized protein Z518_05698 [Rhinocladiella mackenziei CBS 650.93]|uniref:Rhinocladiella mackenziei CBS 650.93 unplaced genomic scaffold supercont1.4, whole genome shotgun sequence n=1 Tax=Rhinocladiella mackenziei CBS 650.93 TaxID=1442369 RepID=A0A0D2FRN3_9EURO|nr:uncharacterized protein Z518_05698 [Rhinocladiella mackenziei CBS 650.93]KIX04827.1 hypothetical protein Z518_05698 [Rhinocladiella mackenziei CBS 650.93]